MLNIKNYLARLLQRIQTINDNQVLNKKHLKVIETKIKKRKTRNYLSKKKKTDSVLQKYSLNPIISPRKEISWDAWQTFNPGAVLIDNKIHFLYRAIGNDGLSRLGYASSSDGCGINERSSLPAYEHHIIGKKLSLYSFSSGGSWGGCEDPRLVYLKEDHRVYLTYTACDDGLRVALTSISAKNFLLKKWDWKNPVLISPPREIHKNWVLFPKKIKGKYAILHSIAPKIQIKFFDNLNFNHNSHINSFHQKKYRKNVWDNWVRGAGAPPLETKYGWLLFYHATSEDNPSKYKIGAVLLDKDNPTRIIARSKVPVLEPSEYYENNGYKGGVVYCSGAIIKNDVLFLYYGAADSYTCVAYANLDNFIRALMGCKKPVMKNKIVTKLSKIK